MQLGLYKRFLIKGGSMLKWNKTSCVWGIDKIIYLKGPYMPLCMDYDIFQMSAAASHSGMDPNGPIFNNSAA